MGGYVASVYLTVNSYYSYLRDLPTARWTAGGGLRVRRPAAVVVSAEEWERRTSRAGTLVDFPAASPLRGASLKIERGKDRPRDIDKRPPRPASGSSS